MAGINVLLDTLKGGNKLEKTSTLKGKDVADSSENAAAVFAAILSGSMNSNADPKGQNSSIAGQESEETQNAGDPVQFVQNPNGQGSMLGYGNFALSFITQPMLQSDLPAGKEANSGDVVSQGTGSNNLESAKLLNQVSLVSDEVFAQSGMTTPKPQGDNPGITELDKYRQVIAELLVALSGEITNTSLKGTPLSSESSGTKDLSQDIVKIVQNWMTVTDENVDIPKALQEEGLTLASPKGNLLSSENTGVKDFRQDLAKIVQDWMTASDENVDILKEGTTLAGNPLSSENTGVKDFRQDLAKIVQDWMTLADDDANKGQASTGQKGIQPLIDVPQGVQETLMNKKGMRNSTETAITVANDTDILINPQQKSAKVGLQESKSLKNNQGVFNEEIHKGDPIKYTEPSVVKDQNQNSNSNISIGMERNNVVANVADGKTVAIPVWEQIATVFREQVTNRHLELKELDIQLHPVDLGKIQIAMRWENGQVHLQVQASEAATGQLLQNQLSDLRHTLMSQGVNCGMLQMGQGGERQQNPHGDESQRKFKQSSDLDEDLIPVNPTLSLGQDEINRINVMA